MQSAAESVALGEKLGHVPSALHALWFAATAHFLRRETALTADCGARLLALAREHGLTLYQAHSGTIHGWALAQLGGGEEALADLRASFCFWAETSKVMLDVGGLRGDLLRAGSAEEEHGPEHFYRQAIAIAQDQQAKSFELRAATALARLEAGQGRRGQARELLAPVYDWFTEGFDTIDLKDAKALLDELR